MSLECVDRGTMHELSAKIICFPGRNTTITCMPTAVHGKEIKNGK
jgi:hypothetical protein